MEFSNINVEVKHLPTIDDVNFKHLETNYLNASRIAFVIFMLVIAIAIIAFFYFIKVIQVPVVMYSTVAVFITLTVLGWLANTTSFNYSGYALREKDILFRRGWLVQKVRIVPLKRVQHVSLQSGPIERKFGLASISIFTAGSAEADFTIKGITQQTAQQIKDWISSQLNGEAN